MKLLATMGDSADEGICRIVTLDFNRGSVEPWLTWTPPPPLRVPGKGFTGMAWSDPRQREELYVCSAAALCRVDASIRTIVGVLHQPCMNDLHHVALDRDRILLANTGADRVDVLTREGTSLGGWDFAPAWVGAARLAGAAPSRDAWERARTPDWNGRAARLDLEPAGGEYYTPADADTPFHQRKLRDFVHPNHIALLEDRVYVSRFHDRSIQCLADSRVAIASTPGHPHDGVVDGDRFWSTCAQGLLVSYVIDRGRLVDRELDRIDVFERTGRSGWCRGLIVTPDLFFVGMTRIERMPRVRWCDRPFEQTETSVLAIDRRRLTLEARIDLGHVGQQPKIFALMEAP